MSAISEVHKLKAASDADRRIAEKAKRYQKGDHFGLHPHYTEESVLAALAEARAEERERCAKVAENTRTTARKT